jgi:cytochrome b pre-mRNA-processing protein 3
MMLPLFRRGSRSRNIRALYGAIVAQARSPFFYAEYGVPDTVEGRFDLIVLHLVLVLRRLGQDDPAVRAVGQDLFDAFCRDLDENLREMGVGDLAVPKRMQQFAEAFYGRQAAYLAALAGSDPRNFEKALARNIFQVASLDDGAGRLAQYARAVSRALDAAATAALVRGEVVLPNPEAFVHARA